MYDLAKRDFDVRTTTGPLLGPNTYVVCVPKSQLKNFAPFLSCDERKNTFINKLSTEALYNVREYGHKIKNCASLKSTSKRFVSKADDIPPPTRYNPTYPKCKKNLKLDPTKPKLYACKVPHSITVIAPSVPTKIDQYGYDIDDDGNILKIQFEDTDYLDLDIPSQFPSNQGWRWSCRNTIRFDAKAHETVGPGPGAYYAQLPKCPQAEADEKYREMARLFSFVPRFVEAQEMKAQKERLPGPGTYDINAEDKADLARSKSINPRPFISQSSRFKKSLEESPSPAHYTINNCHLDKKEFSIKDAPFGFESERFQRKKLEHRPGPADYELKSPLLEKLRSKKNANALCHAPFGQTAMRKLGFAKSDAECTPSAADYPVEKDEEEDETTEIYSSVFMSAVERFKRVCKKEALGPANYNITEIFNKNRGRTPHGTGMAPFNFAGPRSTTPAVFHGAPCPTRYNKGKPLGCEGGYSFNVTPRFKEQEETPGPGEHYLHPTLTNSTYKAFTTHNLRLKENVLRKKIRLPTNQTRKQWCSVFKKKKLMICFHQEPTYEEKQTILINKLFSTPI